MIQSNVQDLHSVVLRLNGVATARGDGLEGEGFLLSPMGGWRPLIDDGLFAIEEECVQLHQELAERIFGNLDDYHLLLPFIPQFVTEAGLNSESLVSRDRFEQLLGEFTSFPKLNWLLYLCDCRALISAIQECTKEVSQLTGEFYRILNLDPFFGSCVVQEDGVRWSTSPVVTILHATLGFLFIRMHSLLDYLAKLAKEVDGLKMNFATYPKLASTKFLFGDVRHLKVNDLPGSLFERCDEVVEVESVRNLLIHDGLLDDMPKAYEVIESGVTIERFVLMPDRRDGNLEKYKNRRLFYSRDDKINLRLASLVRSFQNRQLVTLKGIRKALATPT